MTTDTLPTRRLHRVRAWCATVVAIGACAAPACLTAQDARRWTDYTDSVYAAGQVREFQHILVEVPAPRDSAKARARIADLQKALAAGTDFAQLARTKNDDETAALSGGLLPFGGRGLYVREFEAAAWALEPGAVTGPVATRFGFHLIRRPPLAEVRPILARFIAEEMLALSDTSKSGSASWAPAIQAEWYLNDYLKDFPGDSAAGFNLFRAMLGGGDAQQAASATQTLTTNAKLIGEDGLVTLAVVAEHSDQPREATALLVTVLRANPNSRDALARLANLLVANGQLSEVLPLVQQLVALDPGNPQVYELAKLYYLSLASSAAAAAVGKPSDSEEAVRAVAMSDSVRKYTMLHEKPTVVVRVGLVRAGADLYFAGRIENRAAEVRKYTLNIEFLDASGKVVSRARHATNEMAQGATAQVQVRVGGKTVAAFRYVVVGR